MAVDTVANMVWSYINTPDCLILVTISMAGTPSLSDLWLIIDDIENQAASRVARRCDKEGKRTIGAIILRVALTSGVLTKADMVTDPDAYQRWAGIVNGTDRQYQLSHGYYITMQHRPRPDSTWKEILQDETTFFNTGDWGTFVLPERLGCLHLRKRLSEELSDLIRERSSSMVISLINQNPGSRQGS